MKKLNKQTLNLSQLAKETRLANEYAQAKTPIFKAILTTLDGNKTFYFKSLKALNAFAKREQNFGLSISRLALTDTKINVNRTIFQMQLKLKDLNEKTGQKWAEFLAFKQQKNEVRASQEIDQESKRKMVQSIEENMRNAKKEYYNTYNNELRQLKLRVMYLLNVVRFWNVIQEIPLKTSILRRYN